MVRKSNSERKGISKAPQKGPALRKGQNIGPSWLKSIITKHCPFEKFTELTEFLFNSFLYFSITLRVVPLEHKEAASYRVPTGRRLMPYFVHRLSTLLITVHHIGVCVNLCLTQEITASVLFTVIYSVVLALMWILSVWNPVDTAFLWSNMESLLKDLSLKGTREFHRFDKLVLCLKILCVLALIPICTVCCAVWNGLLYEGLPTSWFRSLQSLGWLNAESENVIWWLVAFLPLEAITVLVPLIPATLVCMMMYTGVQTMRTYGEEIRRIEIKKWSNRKQVEERFIRWQVFGRLMSDWTKLIAVPMISVTAAAVTILLFLTMRFTNVPLFVYICFPTTAFSFLVLLMLTMYEAVSVTQISEQVLSGKLLCFDHCELMRLMLKDERKEMSLRAKAFRPIAFPIGPFTEVKYSVMADIWEEMLNQLLFLLSF